ncbi:hypothetical protein [Prescottella equi]|uniref:Uncharacterized protein n=1 Tax=Prescottella equi ATCC 33707 TaxID=525370 RepID=E9T085_RHOHA|nr:hypothetical protein [Prescottella equi]EGD24668.1 hypothetical protein HMPREF0724_11786 [Prescottella equi ATCC 33707]
MHLERKHIAAIAPTVDAARQLCRDLKIPATNAISGNSVDCARGRSFAGYILAPGYLPAPDFWEAFAPSLMAAPQYDVEDLRAMLAAAEEKQDAMNRQRAQLALAPR